jgi:DNA-binding transcriptional MerR regulator
MPASPKSPARSRAVRTESPEATLPPSAAVLRIGDLAARAGVSADTLRYYERRGLLQPSGRRASGYREYPPEAAGIVLFIKHAQVLGFTLAEIDELLQLRGSAARRGTGLAVHEVAVAKIHDIDEKLRMLGTLRRALADLVVECEQTCGPDTVVDARDCPIIAALSAESLAPFAPFAPVAHGTARASSDRGRGT